MQDAEIVGVGRQRMGDAILRSHFRRQDRSGIDPVALRAKQSASCAEDGAELALGDRGHLADPLELIFVEPAEDVLGNSRQNGQGPGRQERCFASMWHEEGPVIPQPSRRPAIQPSGARRRFRHQFVHRRTHRQRNPKPRFGFPADPIRDIHQRAEQSFGTGEIEKGMAVTARLDDGRIDPENVVQRAGGASIEPGIRRKQHEIRAELLCLTHQHPARDSRRLGLGRKREDGGAIGPRGCYGNRSAPERGCHHSLDSGDERRRVDEQNGACHGIQEERQR